MSVNSIKLDSKEYRDFREAVLVLLEQGISITELKEEIEFIKNNQ
jgi:hypothetical protein